MSHANIDIGSFYLCFDKPVHDYTPYEQISGVLCAKFNSDIKTTGLVLKIVGKLGVLWQENEYSSTEKTSKASTYTKANTFLNETIQFPLEKDPTTGEMTVPKGDHEFKFSFRLIDFLKVSNVTPQRMYKAFPSSSDHEYGSVKYTVTGIINRTVTDFDYQTSQSIRILSAPSDMDELHAFFLPYKGEKTKDSSLIPSASSSGNTASLKVALNKTAFKPGETIDCLIKLENENSMRKFSKLYIKLVQTATFHSEEPAVKTKTVKHDIFSYKQTDFDNNRYYDMDEIIQIPKSTQPASTLDSSHFIQYKYELKFELFSSLKFLPSAPSQPIEITVPFLIYNQLAEQNRG
jgi:hypothetical protein